MIPVNTTRLFALAPLAALCLNAIGCASFQSQSNKLPGETLEQDDVAVQYTALTATADAPSDGFYLVASDGVGFLAFGEQIAAEALPTYDQEQLDGLATVK